METNNIKGSFILCLTALIWGLGFVAQSAAADKIPPLAFTGIRSLIGALFLFCFLTVKNKGKVRQILTKDRSLLPDVLRAGVICGIILAVSVNFQQTGLRVYPPNAPSEARGGFITALYVILVPFFTLFSGKRIAPAIWVAVLVAAAGIYLLCINGQMSGIYLGDVLMFLCAVCFTLHIFAVDKFVTTVDGPVLSMLQFAVCGIISLAVSFIFERFDFGDVINAAPQILYLGIMSSGIAYTLQIVGQKYAEPAVASISMSLESVFAALGGWVISGSVLIPREILGCTLVFAAIILAQLPDIIVARRYKKANRKDV